MLSLDQLFGRGEGMILETSGPYITYEIHNLDFHTEEKVWVKKVRRSQRVHLGKFCFIATDFSSVRSGSCPFAFYKS